MLAPLVSLLADRRMAAGEVDTNQKRFATGSPTIPLLAHQPARRSRRATATVLACGPSSPSSSA